MRLIATLIATAALFAASSAGAVAVNFVGASATGSASVAPGENVTIELRMTSDANDSNLGISALGVSARDYGAMTFVSGRAVRRYLNDGGGTFLSNVAGTSSGGANAQRILAQNSIGAFGPRVQIALSAALDPAFPDGSPDPGLEAGTTTPMFRLVFQAPNAPGVYTIRFDGDYQGDGTIRPDSSREAVGGVTYTVTVVPEPGTALLMGLGLMGLAAAGRRN